MLKRKEISITDKAHVSRIIDTWAFSVIVNDYLQVVKTLSVSCIIPYRLSALSNMQGQ